jgi:excisionase family DNA binding protein
MMKPSDNQALLLTAPEAAKRLSISPKTLWTHTQPRGSIPAIRFGRSTRYSVAALEKWIAEQIGEGAA